MRDLSTIDRLTRQFSHGRMDRREFIRQSMAVGLSLAAAQALAVKSARADTPKRGGTLILGINNAGTSDSLDPAFYTSSYTQIVGPQLYNTLAELDVKNQVQPSLATGWETKPGAKIWVVKLRDGVTFHNGKTLTAEDVIYSINHHRGKDFEIGREGPAGADCRHEGERQERAHLHPE